jgi:hypothetical protein
MLKEVVKVEVAGRYRLHVEFEDGVAGEIDVPSIIPFEASLRRCATQRCSARWQSIPSSARFAGRTARTSIPTSSMP